MEIGFFGRTDGRIAIRPFHMQPGEFEPFLVLIRGFPGRLWHGDNRQWSIPDRAVSLDAFLDLLLRTGGFEVVPVHSPGPDDLTARTREALEVRHYSPRTVGTYLQWIDRFAASVAPQTLASTDDSEINAFLTRLAADGNVASSSS